MRSYFPTPFAVLALAILAAPAHAATVTLGTSPSSGTPEGSCAASAWVPQGSAPGTPSYAVLDGYGVVTSWSTKSPAGTPASVKLKVFRPTGVATQFLVVDESSVQAVPADTPTATFQVRIPVQSGDLIGLGTTVVGSACYYATASAWDAYQFTGDDTDPPKGSVATLAGGGASGMRRLNISANVETDADGDGYGDDTQDLCPTNASTQATCPETPPGSAADTTAPTISSLKVSPRRFRARRGGGSAAKLKAGTAFSYTLSEPATVTFTIERSRRGHRVNGKCRRGRASVRIARRRACTLYSSVGTFAQQGSAGQNSKKFAGRIGKKALRTGRYRAGLVGRDAAGNASSAVRASFSVVAYTDARLRM